MELNPAASETVRAVHLVVGFRDLELSGLYVRRRRRLRFETELRDDRRIDGDQTARRQIAPRLLPATVEEQLVLDNWSAHVGGAGVDLRRRLDGITRNGRTIDRRCRAATAEEEW